MDVELVVGISIPVIFIAFMIVEAAFASGRNKVTVRNWRAIGIAGFCVTMLVNAFVPPVLLDQLPVLQGAPLANAGIWSALLVVLLTTFVTYWTHRIEHRYDLLWRLTHQLHHSVARVDTASAFILHPFDVAIQTGATTLVSWLLGASTEAAAAAGLIGFAIGIFQHWDINTPRWIGLVIQRPEAHMLHHERGIHFRNFGDITWWDMIFGTYSNPVRGRVDVGFEPGRARHVLAMVLFQDVNRVDENGRGRWFDFVAKHDDLSDA